MPRSRRRRQAQAWMPKRSRLRVSSSPEGGSERPGDGAWAIPEPASPADCRLAPPHDPGPAARQRSRLWRPHSVLPVPLQRPARSSSPTPTGRVQGQQPIEM